MNTENYCKLIEYSYNAGELPQDLYDDVMQKIKQNGKINRQIYNWYLDELERRRLFYVDGTPFNTKNSAITDGTFKYRRHNPFWYMWRGILTTVFKFLGLIGGGFGYGVWRIKDAKKFKKLGACLTLSNHVGYLDACITRRALGCKKQYIVAAPHNCKRNLGGTVLKCATVIPLPTTFSGTKPFNEMIEFAVKNRAAIHFYAEQSLWLHYKKPRPYKDGPFHYAAKLNVPVVVMFYCFGQAKGLRKLLHMPKVTVKIADPIYPDMSLPPVKRKDDLAEKAQSAVTALYENYYGVPLEYLPPHQTDNTADAAVATETATTDESTLIAADTAVTDESEHAQPDKSAAAADEQTLS